MTVNYRYIGKGTTDSNGVAHISEDANGDPISPPGDVGVGAGLIDVVASKDDPDHISGMSLQETYELMDAIFYDNGASDNSSNWSLSSVGYSSDGEAVTLNNATGSTKWCIPKVSSSTTGYVTSGNNYIFEFELLNVNSETVNVLFGGQSFALASYISTSDWTHIKYVVENGICSVYVGDSSSYSTRNTVSFSETNISFRISNNESYKFKNIKLYPI